MALVGNDLGDLIVTALQSVDGSMNADQIAQLRSAWRAVAGAIVTYVQTNADVLPSAHSGPALNNPAGQAVNIPVTSAPGLASTGATSALENIAGKGSIQ